MQPGLVMAECSRPVTSFTLSDLVAFFPQTAQIILCKTSPDPIWFWLCQVFAKQIWSRSKPVCKKNQACFWPMPPSWSRSDPACLLGRWQLTRLSSCSARNITNVISVTGPPFIISCQQIQPTSSHILPLLTVSFVWTLLLVGHKV